MSGTNVNTGLQHALFNRLISEKSGAFELKEGQLESNGMMSLRSGMHRVFGQEKSEQDVRSNQETLKFVLSHVMDHVSDVEMERIMRSQTRLGGDEEGRTVQERLDRGSYVSSELISQLRTIATRVREQSIRENILDENPRSTNPRLLMTTEEKTQNSRTNREQVGCAFSLGVGLGPGSMMDNMLGLQPGGDIPSTFRQALDELCEEGLNSGDRLQTETWKQFQEYWTTTGVPPGQDQERIDTVKEFRRLCDVESFHEFHLKGGIIDQVDIKALLKDVMSSPEQMKMFEDRAKVKIESDGAKIAEQRAREIAESNTRRVENMGPDGLSGTITEWLKDDNNKQFKEPGQRLLQQLDKAGEWMQELGLSTQELKSVGEIEKLVHGEQPGPLQLTENLREALKQNYETNPSLEILNDEHVSKLLDGTLREILGAPPQQPVVNEKVQEDLKTHFRSLSQEIGNRGPFGGNTLSETTRALLAPQIEEFALKQAILKAREDGENLGLPEVQQQISENAKQMIDQHRQMQESVLPVLDDFVAFQNEVETLRNGEGGLKGLSKEKLQELDRRSYEIQEKRDELYTYTQALKNDFGLDVEDIVDEFDQLRTDLSRVTQYDLESGLQDRQYIDRVEKQLSVMSFGENFKPQRQPGMTDTLYNQVAPFPSLRQFIQLEFTGIENCKDMSDLLKRAVYDPLQERLESYVKGNSTLFSRNRVMRETMGGLDDMWNENIVSKLKDLEGFSLPPDPPQTLTPESIDQYRQSLTEYIDRTKDISIAFYDLSETFKDLGKDNRPEGSTEPPLLTGRIKRTIEQARDALTNSEGIVLNHIARAQHLLEALN